MEASKPSAIAHDDAGRLMDAGRDVLHAFDLIANRISVRACQRRRRAKTSGRIQTGSLKSKTAREIMAKVAAGRVLSEEKAAH